MITELAWPWINTPEATVYSNEINWPKVSIVTPTYNQGAYIEETILSVLNQNYPDLEYIIIDGGSTDNTIQIIKKYETKITYWISEPDNGQTHAINKGFSKATGAIYAYLNSDDCYYPNTLKTIAETFIDQKDNTMLLMYGYCQHGATFSDLMHKSTGAALFNIKQLVLGYGLVPQPSTFWSANDSEFNENLEFCMDHDHWYKLLKDNYKPVLIPGILSFYREHQEAKGSKIKERMWEEFSRLTMTYISDFPALADKIEILEGLNSKLFNYNIQLLNRASASSKKELRSTYIKLFKLNPVLGLKLLRYIIGLYRSNK